MKSSKRVRLSKRGPWSIWETGNSYLETLIETVKNKKKFKKNRIKLVFTRIKVIGERSQVVFCGRKSGLVNLLMFGWLDEHLVKVI